MTEEKDKVVLEGQEAIDLYRQGKDAWNAWVKANPVADVDFSFHTFDSDDEVNGKKTIDFSNFLFPRGNVNFLNTTFIAEKIHFKRTIFNGGFVDFSGANFGSGEVNFSGANFGDGDTHFIETKFYGENDLKPKLGNGGKYFIETKFCKKHSNVFFTNAKFGDGIVHFDRAEFGDGNLFFMDANFNSKAVWFKDADFGEGDKVDFMKTNFGSSDVNFENTNFSKISQVNFKETIFCNSVIVFHFCKFGGAAVSFKDAKFMKCEVSYEHAHFDCRNTEFNNACFEEGTLGFGYSSFENTNAHFNNVKFLNKHTSFYGCYFGKVLAIEGCTFNSIPDFISIKISHHVAISNIDVTFPKTMRIELPNTESEKTLCKYYPNKRDVIKLRRLKQLAGDAKDHRLELNFFAEELRAKRYHEVKGFRLIPNYLYGWLSDFGRSLARPFLWLVVFIFLLFPFVYMQASCKDPSYFDTFKFSFSQSIPLIPISKTLNKDGKNALFNKKDVKGKKDIYDIPLVVYGASIFQNISSTVFIALFLLALRNRFKMK